MQNHLTLANDWLKNECAYNLHEVQSTQSVLLAICWGKYFTCSAACSSGPTILTLSLRNTLEVSGRSSGIGTLPLSSQLATSLHMLPSEYLFFFPVYELKFCVKGLYGRNSLRKRTINECGAVFLEPKISEDKKHSLSLPLLHSLDGFLTLLKTCLRNSLKC